MTPQLSAYDVDSDVELAAAVKLLNRLKPHRATTVDETRGRLAQETRFQLFLARTDAGDVAATLELATWDLDREPTLWLATLVNPDVDDHDALLGQVAALARSWAPDEAAGATRAIVMENDACQLAWWSERGFVETERQLQVELELTNATLPPASQRDDLTLVTIVERPDLLAEAYRLFSDGLVDMPGDAEFVKPTYERWRSDNDALPLPPEHELLLLQTKAGVESAVGYASLLVRKARPGFLRHGMTTIAREARGQQLAREFKSLLLHRAVELGFNCMGTSNESTNVAMRRVNDAMGFKPMPAVLLLRGQLP